MSEGLSILDVTLERYPVPCELPSGLACEVRPLRREDEVPFWDFFQAVPEKERLFIKHQIRDPKVIESWCQEIDYGRNLPLLALLEGQVIGACTLHQQLGGWKRHIGRVSVLIHPLFRERGLARALVTEMIDVARNLGLEKLEAEFIAEQKRAIHVFALLGFSELLTLEAYVRDMQAVSHDYLLLGMELTTDEEYAGVG